jgi:P pilus assembly chaperone PapD
MEKVLRVSRQGDQPMHLQVWLKHTKANEPRTTSMIITRNGNLTTVNFYT